MTELYPLHLQAPAKSPIWGGTKLKREWNKESEQDTIGETWELCVRKNEVCTVQNGDLRGKTLKEVIDLYGNEITGGGFGSADFPLLVKLIDAADDLSVQVHPDDAYAARVEGDRGKTEMWYIVQADAGAEIICGLEAGMSAKAYAEAVKNGDYLAGLCRVPVEAGEVYFIPAGLPHAIGKGILIAEIQQNCDLTYRVFDYNRRQPDGSLRELHTKKALDVIRAFSKEEIDAVRYARGREAENANLLANCDYFRVEKIEAKKQPALLAKGGTMRHLLCIGGAGELLCNGQSYPVKKGDSWLIPAVLEQTEIAGDCTVLVASV
jgi:mannose-6-phosphate isomerase